MYKAKLLLAIACILIQVHATTQTISIIDHLSGKGFDVNDFSVLVNNERCYVIYYAQDTININGMPVAIDSDNGAHLFLVDSSGAIKFRKDFTNSSVRIGYDDKNVMAFLTFKKDTLVTTDTTIVKTGTEHSNNMVFLKYDLNGELLKFKHWTSPFDCRYEISDIARADNYFFVTGQFRFDTLELDVNKLANINSSSFYDAFVASIDIDSLKCHWLAGLGGNVNDYSTKIAAVNKHEVLTTGTFDSNWFYACSDSIENLWAFSYEDMYISLLDSTGECSWLEHVGGSNAEVGTGVGFLSDGSIIVAGNYYGGSANFGDTLIFNPTSTTNGFIARYSFDGVLEKVIQLQGNDHQRINNLIVTDKDDIWVCGHYASDTLMIGSFRLPYRGGGGDGFIAKYDKEMSPLFAISFGGKKLDSCIDLQEAPDKQIFALLRSTRGDTINIGNQKIILPDTPGNSETFTIGVRDSSITNSVELPEQYRDVKIYPNPVTSGGIIQYFIQNIDQSNITGIRIINLFGQLEKEYIINKTTSGEILTPQLPSGMYFILFEVGNRVITQRLIVSEANKK